LTGWLKHAFEVDPPGPAEPSAEERDLIDRLARAVVRRGMTTPAILALECSRNLNFIASQVLVFFAPLVKLIFNRREYSIFTGFLERRGSIPYLCDRIEEFQALRENGADGNSSPETTASSTPRGGDAGAFQKDASRLTRD
jgi:hypothetical protein